MPSSRPSSKRKCIVNFVIIYIVILVILDIFCKLLYAFQKQVDISMNIVKGFTTTKQYLRRVPHQNKTLNQFGRASLRKLFTKVKENMLKNLYTWGNKRKIERSAVKVGTTTKKLKLPSFFLSRATVLKPQKIF